MTGPDGYPVVCPDFPAFTFVPVADATTRGDAICALAHNFDQAVLAGVVALALLVFFAAMGVYTK